MTISRTQQAIDWLVANPGATQEEAAFLYGLTQSAVSNGLRSWRRKHPALKAPDARNFRKTRLKHKE